MHRSTQNCVQRLNSNFILETTECFEEHLFKPFASGDNGAIIYLIQNLQYVSNEKETSNFDIPKNIRYDSLLTHYNEQRPKKVGTMDNVMMLLTILDTKTVDSVDPDVPEIFSQLVREMENLDVETMITIFESVRTSMRQKKFLLDGMSLVPTADGIQAIKYLYVEEEISHSHMNSWLTSITFYNNISLPILNAITPLLESNIDIRQAATLSASAIIYKYCNQDKRCYDKQEVQTLIKIMSQPLKSTCVPYSSDNHDEILLSLKAIGNIGMLSSLEYLRNCFLTKDAPMELRLAAIAAHRRISCDGNENLNYLEAYLANGQENTEIRIASYLAAMQCASYSTFARIKDILRSEETNQVGSFIWTHLTNLQESSTRWKQNLKGLVENEFLRNKFNTDMRKYSRNYELSTFFDSINTGATTESNVIFTSESYLPKSIMLNFTLDLFGESVNVFEIGARMEGFEQIFENVFGPDGVLSGMQDNDLPSEPKLKHIGEIFASKSQFKEPSGLLHARVFGNELAYSHFNNAKDFMNLKINRGTISDTLIKFFRQQDIDYTKSMVFIDSSYEIPTLLGFPLKLAVNGTSTVGLTLTGKMDLKDLWSNKIDVKAKMYPSAAVEIIGTMIVDCFFSSMGLRSKSKLNTNTYFDGHALINKGRLIDININVPKKQMNIVNIESEMHLIGGDHHYPIHDITDNIINQESCTKQTFSKVTGLKFCHTLHYVNGSLLDNAPHFPLTGKFKYLLDITKTDIHDSYQLKLKRHKEIKKFQPLYSMEILLDTPKSITDRKFLFYYLLDFEQLSLNAAIKSPFIKLEIDSKIGTHNDDLQFILQTKLNHDELLLANMSLKSTKLEDEAWQYVGVSNINYKSKQIAALYGNINYLEGSKYNAALQIEGINSFPIKLNGKFQRHSNRLQLSTLVESEFVNVKAQALMLKNAQSVSVDANAMYDVKNLKPQTIDFEFKSQSLISDTSSDRNFFLKINSTQNSYYNTILSLVNYQRNLYSETTGHFVIFDNSWEVYQLFKYRRDRENNDMAFKCFLKCIQQNIDYKIDMTHFKSPNSISLHSLLQLNKIQRIEAAANYNIHPQSYSFNLLLYYPEQSWTANGVFTRLNVNDFDIIVRGFSNNTIEQKVFMTLTGGYKANSDGHLQNHSVTGLLNFPQMSSNLKLPWTVSCSLHISSDILISSAQLQAKNNVYISSLSWTPNSAFGALYTNEKKIIWFSGIINEHEVSLLYGLNIYQHFELSTKLIRSPFEQFKFVFYWDKDVDIDQRIYFSVDKNFISGLYLIKMEYPTQKVNASFIFLSSQVSMNIMWGIDSANRIYLEAGNELNDIGATWFVTLETPFKYLESQKFRSTYYCVAENAELKVEVAWHDQQINFLASGKKLPLHISAYMEINTTFAELTRIVIVVNHSHNTTDDIFYTKNDVVFVFNNQQVQGQFLWKAHSGNILSTFELMSPTNIILPIAGSLMIHNSESVNRFTTCVAWKKKHISFDCKVQNRNSYVKIITPFEGLETTELNYTIEANNKGLIMDTTINVLRSYNHALLLWSSNNEIKTIKFEITSPIVGSYTITFKHSTLPDSLEEHLVITQGCEKEIMAIKLQGNIWPLSLIHLCATFKVLENNSSLYVKNRHNHFISKIESRWKEHYVLSDTYVIFLNTKISMFNWNISSSILDENILALYHNNNSYYTTSLDFPKGYKFNNVLKFESLKSIHNLVRVTTPWRSGTLLYTHVLNPSYCSFKNEIILQMNEHESSFVFKYNINNSIYLIDSAVIKFKTPWHKTVLFNFSMPFENLTTLKPMLYLQYANVTLSINSIIIYHHTNGNIEVTAILPYCNPIKIIAKYDFTKSENLIEAFIKNGESVTEVIARALVNNNEHVLFMNAMRNDNGTNNNLLELSLKYYLKTIKFKMYIPGFNNIQIEAVAEENLKGYLEFSSMIPEWEKINVSISLLNSQNYLKIIKNNKILTIQSSFLYLKNAGAYILNTDIFLLSDFQSINNYSLKLNYEGSHLLKNFELKAAFHKSLCCIADSFFYISYQTPENKQIYDIIKVKLSNVIEGDKNNGILLTVFNSNIPYVEDIYINSNYKILKNRYISNIVLKHNQDIYNIETYLEPQLEKLELWFNFKTPIEMCSNAVFKLVASRHKDSIETIIFAQHNSNIYNASVFTTNQWPLTITEFNLSTPVAKYGAQLETVFALHELHIRFTVIFDNYVKKIELYATSENYLDSELSFYSNIDILTMKHILLRIKYNLCNIKQMSTIFQITYGPNFLVQTILDIHKLDVIAKIDTLPKFVLTGTHNIMNTNNLSVSYISFYQNESIKIDMSHMYSEDILSSLNISTTFNNWSNLVCKTWLNRTKLDLLIGMNDYIITIMTNKDALFNNNRILEFNYNNHPLILIWTGNEKSYIETFLPLSTTKMTIEYSTELRIYGILVIHEKVTLYSIKLENIHLEDYFNSTVKMISPLLAPYSNLTLHLHTKYIAHNGLEFVLENESNTILAISYNTQKLGEYYDVALYLNSVFEALQSVVISFKIKPEFSILCTASTKQYYKHSDYKFTLIYPINSNFTLVELRYPLQNDYILLLFFMKYNMINFNLKTPFLNLNQTTVIAKLANNTDIFKYKNKYDTKVLFFDLNIHNKFFDRVGLVRSSIDYNFWNDMKFTLNVDEYGNKLDVIYTSNGRKTLLEATAEMPCLLIGDLNLNTTIQFDQYIKGVLNINQQNLFNGVVYYNISKNTDINSDLVIHIMENLCYYNSSFTYNHKNGYLAGFIDSKTLNYLLQLTTTSSVDKSFKNGNISATVINGWTSEGISEETSYNLFWIITDKLSNKSAIFSFTRNADSTYIDLFSIITNKHLNSGLIISCGGKALDLQTEARSSINSSHAVITMTTPLQEMSVMHFETSVMHSNNAYIFNTTLIWPNNKQILAALHVNKSSLYLQIVSPFNDPFRLKLFCNEMKNNQISINLGVVLGKHNFTLFGSTFPQYLIATSLHSPFSGYRYVNASSSLNLLTQTIQLYIQKEALVINIGGKAYNEEKLVLLRLTDTNGGISTIQIKLNTSSKIVDGKILWNNKYTQFNLIYNPNNLLLQINSQFDQLKDINIQGYYNKTHLQLNGVWNDMPIHITNSMSTDNYSMLSKLTFAQNNIEFKSSIGSRHNFIVLILPFVNIKTVAITVIIENNSIKSNLHAHFLGELLVSNLSINKNKGEISTNMNLTIPQITTQLEFQFNLTTHQQGDLKILYANSEKFINLMVNYKINNSKLVSHYTLDNNGYQIDSDIIVHLHSDEIHIVFDKYELLYKIRSSKSIFETIISATLPYFEINITSSSLTNLPKYQITLECLYRDYSVTLAIHTENVIGYSKATYNVGNYKAVSMFTDYKLSKDKLMITNTIINSHSTISNATLLLVNNEQSLELKGYIDHTLFPPFVSDIYFSKKFKKISANIQSIINLNIEFNSKPKVDLIFLNNNRLNVNMTKNSLNVYIGLPILLKGESITVESLIENNNKFLRLMYLQESDIALKGNVHFSYNENAMLSLKSEIITKNTTVFNCSVNIIPNNVIQGDAFLQLNDQKNKAYLIISITDPFTAGLTIDSPLIFNNGFTFEIVNSVALKTLFTFIGSGYSHAIRQGLLNLESHEKYILFEVEYEKGQFYAKYEAEKLFWINIIELRTELCIEDYNIHLTENFVIKSKDTDYILVYSKFDVFQHLDISLHTKIPMLMILPKFKVDLLIPFTLTKNFRPNLFLGLPNGHNYSAQMIYSHVNNQITLSAKYEYKESNANVIVNLRNRNVFSQLCLPIGKFELSFKVPKDLQTGQKIDNYVDIFGTVLKLNYYVIYKHTRKLFNVQLITPFHSYEQFSVDLEYQNNQINKVLKALAIFPLVENEFGVNLSIKYNGVREFNIGATISLPFGSHGFKCAALNIMHYANFKNNNTQYLFQFSTRVNNFSIGLDLATMLNSNTIFRFNSYAAEKNFILNLNMLGDIAKEYEFLFELGLPTALIKSVSIFLTHSSNPNQGFHTYFKYNYKTLWNIDFVPQTNHIHFYISNILKHISIECKYSYIDHLETSGKICWNLNYPDVSQVGLSLLFGKNTSLVLTLPTRVVSLTSNHYNNNNNKYHFHELSWSRGKVLALMLSYVNFTENNILNQKSVATLTLPFKTFAIIDELEVDLLQPSNIKSSFILQWDKQNHSRIILQNNFLPGMLESRFSMPSLMHDITLKIDTSLISQSPSYFKTQLEYSNNIEKKIDIEMYYNKVTSGTIERNIVLRHPASKIDYDLHFSTTIANGYTTENMTLVYQNYLLSRRECISSTLIIGHEKFDITGKIQTSKNYISLMGVAHSGTNYKGLSMAMQINDKEPLLLSGIYNMKPMESSVHLSTSIGSSRAYKLFAGFPSKREITAKLTHSLYDSELIDGLVTLRLNSSQLLWLKLNWKNHLVSQFRSYILNEYYDIRYTFEATGQEFINTIHDNIGQQLLNDMLDIHHNLSDYVKKESRQFSDGYGEFIRDFKEGYQLNSFFPKDIGINMSIFLPNWNNVQIGLMDPLECFLESLFNQTVSVIIDTLSIVYNTCDIINDNKNLTFTINDIKNLKLHAKEVLQNGIDDARDALRQMAELAFTLLDRMDDCVTSIKETCEGVLEPYVLVTDDFINYLEQRLTILQILLLDVLDTVQYYIMNLRESHEVIKAYVLYINWLEELHITNLLEPIGDVVESIIEIVITDVNKVLKDYKPYFNAISDAVFGNYKEINALPPLMELREMCNNVYERTLWIWNYHNLSKIVKSYIHQALSHFDDYLASLMELEEGGNDFENVLGQSNYVFRPDLGLVEITQPLPVEWEAFDETPHFEQESLYQKIKRRSEHLIQLQRMYFVEFFATFHSYFGKPTTSLLSPSTNNIASVVGKSHYITFDKKYYNFAGQCSYLLASDLIGNSFSVMVNYAINNSTINKSISLINNGNNYEISSEFGVKLNNHKINLPISLDSLTIVRENYIILIENSKGLKIICNIFYDYCTIELSGWLFGRTGGLLGTLDNEKVTDMSLPDGDKTSDVLKFAESWQIKSPKCVAVNHAYNLTKLNSPFATTLFKTLCRVYFINTNSPIGNCFNLVDPMPFYDMCVNSMKAILNPTICPSIASYKEHCELAGIPTKIPEICVSCNYGVGQNEDIFDSNNPKSIDVVIIQDSCFSDRHNVSLFIKNLDLHLTRRYFIDNQFAVVGFGYDIPKPFVFTNGKKIWTTSTQTVVNSEVKPSMQSSKTVTAVNAINFASNLEFRPGVAKIFVLMHCDTEQDNGNVNNLHKIFGEKDITLHVLKTHVDECDGDELMEMDKKGNILFMNHGFDVEYLNLTVNIKPPEEVRDIYSVLALSTNGSILRMNDNLEEKVDAFSMRWSEIVSQSARYSPCQRCRCVENLDGTGKVECKRCMSPAVKQLLLEYESNLMEFRSDDRKL